jgi:ATP-dependent RNA helicase DDX31/DBP7
MMDNPDAFIHLTAQDQWRLGFDEKIHGREEEKEMIMGMAAKITAGLSSNKQQLVLVGGRPGSGKSRLVFDTMHELKAQGWMSLTCKFDRIIHAQPLSVMSHAFNQLLGISCQRNSLHLSIRTHIEAIMSASDVMRLARHIPCLVNYLRDPMLSANNFDEGSKDQTHRLFIQLLKALSAASPVVFFMDDLQASTLIVSLYLQ